LKRESAPRDAPEQGGGRDATAKPELFHAIGDSGSAAARRALVELGLEQRVRIRNIFYPEVESDFRARGGRTLPAYWDGTVLLEGEEPVLAALRLLAASR
jgi:hypothetical protein